MYTDRFDSDFYYVANHRSLMSTAGDTAAELAWSRRGIDKYMDEKIDEDVLGRKMDDFRNLRF